MAQYKLTYFQLRGKAEAIRMTFSVAGVEFEDVRVSIDDWVSKLKHCEYTALYWLILHNPIVFADLNSEEFSLGSDQFLCRKSSYACGFICPHLLWVYLWVDGRTDLLLIAYDVSRKLL